MTLLEPKSSFIEPISRVEDGLILFQPVQNIPKQDADLAQGQITIRPGLQLPNRLCDQTKQALQGWWQRRLGRAEGLGRQL
jgi:hypothetical protein